MTVAKIIKIRQVAPLLALGALALPGAMAYAQSDSHSDSNSHSGPQKQTPALAQLAEVQAIGSAQETRVSMERIERNVSFDMRDIFRDVPGVSVGGGVRNAQRIYLDGIEGNNLNFTIDGARQGRSLFQHRGGMTGMDPDLLKRVEVQTLGSASSGPGALGGAIRMQTVDAQDLLEAGRQTGARLKTGYASADKGQRASLTAYGMAGRIGVLGHASGTNSSDYRIGSGWRVPQSAAQERDALFKLSVLDASAHTLRLGANHTCTSGMYAIGSFGSDMGYYPPGGNFTGTARHRLERSSYTLEYGHEPLDAPLSWQARLYRNENELSFLGVPPSDFIVSPAPYVRTIENGFAASGTWQQAWRALHNRLTFGMDGYSEKARGTRTRATAPAPEAVRQYLDGRADVYVSRDWALFVQNQLSWQPVTVTVGARYDDYRADYGPKRISGNRVSPNARIDVALPGGVVAHAGYAEAVRASGAIPVGFINRIHPGTGTPPDGLQPETAKRKEAGLSYEQTGVFQPDDRWGGSLRHFDTRIKNMVMVEPGGAPAVRLRNEAPLTSTGWALGAHAAIGNYSSQLSYTHVNVKRSGKPVGVLRREAAAQGDRLIWDNRWHVNAPVTLGYTLEAVRRLKDVPDNTPPRPGYVLHGVQGQWRGAGIQGLDVRLALRNLFDKRYASHTTIYGGDAAGIVEEAGRDIRLELQYRF